MGNFNGVYEVSESENVDLTQAHKEALELLDIVHRICTEKHWPYTLIAQILIGQVIGRSFASLPPSVALALKYEHYRLLRAELERFSKDNPRFLLLGEHNSPQFDSLSIWFAKRNRVKLPEGREKDEIYYYTRISIRPIFYAGDNEWEYTRITRAYNKAILSLRTRAPLPQNILRVRIRYFIRHFKRKWYRKKRDSVHILELENKLGSYPPSRLCFTAGEYKSKNFIKITRQEIEDIVETQLAGHPCCISRHAADIVARYHKKARESTAKYRVSDIVRRGGEDLRRIQLVQTELLVEFDRVCRKNNIRYNIAFGTLLGAVRHGGYIPWDDDVDVILPIEDYLKLDAAMEKDLDTTRFFWRTIDTDKDFNLTYKHLKRNGTVYMKPGREKFSFHKGILIDVFPVFHSANNRFAHWWQTRLCFFFRIATWAYMGAHSERKPFKKFLYRQMSKPGPRRNLQSFMKYATMFPKKNPYYSYYNAPFRSPYHIQYLSDESFDHPIEVSFEGHLFFAPKDYAAALCYVYGADYMLYPVNRAPGHFAILELGDLFSFEAE